jgi:hypothetical protein
VFWLKLLVPVILLAAKTHRTVHMAVLARFIFATLAGVAAAGGALKDLDEKSWKASTEGKNVFVMFQAPW